MRNYDFGILSPFEFECFVRDVLSKRDGIDYSNFAEGKDGGVDLRASYGNGKAVIVQAKRFKTWNELKKTLKKEVDKVKKLNPDRYVIATSVDLTVGNVNAIKEMFSPFILSDNDVVSKQELNKLLGRADYRHIELQYYKLWLSSSALMQAFIDRHIINQTEMEMDEIKETVRTFVMNPCFDKAMKVLLENHYVILSGAPGVGKTTLARMMSFMLFSKKEPEYHYDDFYFILDDITDAYQMIQEGRKQIFFFDDFLGSTRFQQDGKNFDTSLMMFIRGIRRRKDKLFIMTTREYILNDAKNYYEKLKSEDIDLVKCVIDVGEYSDFVKGEILYNHLFDSGMSHEYIMAIKANRNYMKLIRHPNFNPRIIESFVRQAKNETISPDLYFERVLGYFDHPTSVWEGAYDQLEQTAKEMVLVLATMNAPVMYDDWKRAYRWFYEQTHKGTYLDDTTWNHSARTLSDCFVVIEDGGSGRYVTFYNPSIKDFVIKVISGDDEMQERLIKNSVFIEQLFSIFQDGGHPFIDIKIKPDIHNVVIEAFEECWKDFASCSVLRLNDKTTGMSCSPYALNRVEALNKFYDSFSTICEDHPDIIASKISDHLFADHDVLVSSSLDLMNKVDVSLIPKTDMDRYFNKFKNELLTAEDCLKFVESLSKAFEDYSDYGDTDEFHDDLDTIISQDIEAHDDVSEIEEAVEEIEDALPSWNSEWIDGVIANHHSPDDDIDEDSYDYGEGRFGNYEDSDEAKIDNLFATL